MDKKFILFLTFILISANTCCFAVREVPSNTYSQVNQRTYYSPNIVTPMKQKEMMKYQKVDNQGFTTYSNTTNYQTNRNGINRNYYNNYYNSYGRQQVPRYMPPMINRNVPVTTTRYTYSNGNGISGSYSEDYVTRYGRSYPAYGGYNNPRRMLNW